VVRGPWSVVNNRQNALSLTTDHGPRTTDSATEGCSVAVRIRMKRLGRKHRPYYRIVAIDGRQPRDGRVLEELGTYDPMMKNKDNRVTLVPARIKYWLSVGAQPSEKCQVLFKKYMQRFEEAAARPAPTAEAAPTAESPPA